MSAINFISGNIQQLSELTQTNGKSRIKFAMPEDRYYEGRNHTIWHNFTAWGPIAERLANYAKNGTVATVEYRIDYRESNGHRYTNLNVTHVKFLANFGSTSSQDEAQPDLEPQNS